MSFRTSWVKVVIGQRAQAARLAGLKAPGMVENGKGAARGAEGWLGHRLAGFKAQGIVQDEDGATPGGGGLEWSKLKRGPLQGRRVGQGSRSGWRSSGLGIVQVEKGATPRRRRLEWFKMKRGLPRWRRRRVGMVEVEKGATPGAGIWSGQQAGAVQRLHFSR